MATRQSAEGFLNWMRSVDPQAADFAAAQAGPLAGLGQDAFYPYASEFEERRASQAVVADQGTDYKVWIERAADIGKGLLAFEQQRQLLKVNAERAKQGLPPINTLAAQVQVGLAPDIKNLIVIGGLFLAGFFILNLLGKRR